MHDGRCTTKNIQRNKLPQSNSPKAEEWQQLNIDTRQYNGRDTKLYHNLNLFK